MKSASTLIDSQKEFWSAVHGDDAALEENIYSSSTFTKKQRINVYKTTARSMQVMSLMDTYPVCVQILGKDYFKQLAKKYALETPSYDPDMNQYGQTFSNFLIKQCGQRDELEDYSYLPDLARLEWYYQAAYYAADNLAFDMATFQQQISQHPDKLILQLQAGVQPICSAYPIHEIWIKHRENKADLLIQSLTATQFICVYRESYQVKVMPIEAEVYVLLALIRDKKTLLEITQQFSERYDLNRALAFVMQQQWIKI